MADKKDDVYAKPLNHIVDFAFDQKVVDAFPDMIRRSVPGYESIISTLGLIAEAHYQPDSTIYDLGCSLGAATLSVHSRLGNKVSEYICVDSSPEMVQRCTQNLEKAMPGANWTVHNGVLQETELKQASVVILNFTLQFISPESRLSVLTKIYREMLTGGVLILSEKVQVNENSCIPKLHSAFKKANGYSDLEISQKRTALENIMKIDAQQTHIQRLQDAGFGHCEKWFQNLNFCSYLAVK